MQLAPARLLLNIVDEPQKIPFSWQNTANRVRGPAQICQLLAFLMPPVNRTDRLPAVSGLGSSTATAGTSSPNSAMPMAVATVMPSSCLGLWRNKIGCGDPCSYTVRRRALVA